MKSIAFLVSLMWLLSCQANVSDNSATEYDAQLASALGADDYGMKSYVMAFLYRGENQSLDSAARMELQLKHLENINRMAEQNKLVLAGPFLDGGELRGIYIFDVSTIEEAEALTNTDPSTQQGLLRMELKPWYGSAALLQLNDLHTSIAKKSTTD